MIACDYLLFFEVLIPLLTFERLSETLDNYDPIFGELPQSLYSLVNRVFFLQYGFQLLILQVLSRHKFDKMAAECFIVFPLLFVDFFLFLDDFFLVIAHYAPLDGLLLAFEETDHLFSRLHLLSLFLQISVNLLILFVDASNKSSFHKGLWLHFLEKGILLVFWIDCGLLLLMKNLDTWRVLYQTFLIIIIHSASKRLT